MKIKLYLFVLLLNLFIANVYSQPGLIACYPLDNNANDLSGNSYNGTAFNVTPVSDRFGVANNAYHFSGSGSYIDLPYSNFLLDTFSYSVWCKPAINPSSGNYYSVISIGGNVADQSILFGNNSSTGHIGFGAGAWDANIIPHACYQGSLATPNQWYHLVMTRNNTLMNFYINGSLVCSTSAGNASAGYQNTLSALIGARVSTSTQYFIGDIDDVRIFNHVLSLSEIQSMSGSCESLPACLIACYPFDNNAYDLSGNNYNGTAYNVTSTADRFGVANKAYHFSGSGSYIDLPYSNFLLDTYTYSVWCKPVSNPSFGDYYSIISIGGNVADQSVLIGNSSSGHIGFGAGAWDVNIIPHSCYQGALPTANQWYHVVMTRNNTMMNFYINGTLVCSTSAGNASAGYQSTLSALIGSRVNTPTQYFVGDIDDVRIFNCVLSQTEIQNMSASCITTGINEIAFDKNPFLIYPSPSNDLFNISIRRELINGKLSIYNAIGEKIYSTLLYTQQKSINCKLKEGIYFVQVSDGNETWTQRIIKE